MWLRSVYPHRAVFRRKCIPQPQLDHTFGLWHVKSCAETEIMCTERHNRIPEALYITCPLAALLVLAFPQVFAGVFAFMCVLLPQHLHHWAENYCRSSYHTSVSVSYSTVNWVQVQILYISGRQTSLTMFEGCRRLNLNVCGWVKTILQGLKQNTLTIGKRVFGSFTKWMTSDSNPIILDFEDVLPVRL